MAKLAKAIRLDIPAVDINEELSEKVFELSKIHQGNVPLQIRLTDQQNNVSILLKSITTKVEPRLFIKALSDVGKIQYSIV